MPLIKCSDCKREVSDKAKACIHCGNPLQSVGNPQPRLNNFANQQQNRQPGGGFANADELLEQRIEYYQANGYVILKREGDTATLHKRIKGILWSFLNWITAIFAPIGGFCLIFNAVVGILILIATFSLLIVVEVVRYRFSNAYISMTRAGKITETGNVLE
jgi:hypothetical protein